MSAKWSPDDDIGQYPSIDDGKILIIIGNENKSRQFDMWLTLDEAREFSKSIIESVDECKRVIDARKKFKQFYDEAKE